MLAIAKSTGSVRARAASAVLQQYGRQRQYPQIGYYHAKQHNYHYQKNNSRSTLQHGFHTVAQAYSRQQQENEDTHARYNHNAIFPQQQQQQIALYHSTSSNERGAAIVMGLGALSAGLFAASSTVKAYNEWKESQPPPPTPEELEQMKKQQEEQAQQAKAKADTDASTNKAKGGKRENIFSKWFGVGVGSKYYEGGFEDEMTRKEAALILGVRESSNAKRIKEAHRKLLILNHPDTGGSTYMAGKINEAKELLLKGKAKM
jgi:hypothetical protein